MKPHWLTANEIAVAYAKRQLSPVELLRSLLDRIARLDPKLHAFTRLDADFAMRAAQSAEQEIFAGRSRGKLHGVPIGIKDIIDVAGLPTTCNSRLQLDCVAARDAHVVARLRAAGAIILGKLGTHEFAIGGPSFDLPFPPPRNPWNLDHHPGGSSSGSGAGVSAGLFPLALGSDPGGSVRYPASACGITGLKPSFGLVSRAGVAPLDHVGPLARTAGGAALLLDCIAGHDPDDRGSIGSTRLILDDEFDLQGLRIGFVRHFHERDAADPEVVAALEQVAAVFAATGAQVSTVMLPELDRFAGVCRVILGCEVWPIHAQRLRSRAGEYGQLSRQRLMSGAFFSANDYLLAQRLRAEMIAQVNQAFGSVDVLLTGSALVPPCRIEDPKMLAETHQLQAWTPFNVTGHPAVSIMAGMSKSGLPLSAQLVAPLFSDGLLLSVAAAWERRTDWHTLHPSVS
jgi:aspartyl-tRNA(Asn)/glutamyl-tRNA(Gln) amidotransferase subunit A